MRKCVGFLIVFYSISFQAAFADSCQPLALPEEVLTMEQTSQDVKAADCPLNPDSTILPKPKFFFEINDAGYSSNQAQIFTGGDVAISAMAEYLKNALPKPKKTPVAVIDGKIPSKIENGEVKCSFGFKTCFNPNGVNEEFSDMSSMDSHGSLVTSSIVTPSYSLSHKDSVELTHYISSDGDPCKGNAKGVIGALSELAGEDKKKEARFINLSTTFGFKVCNGVDESEEFKKVISKYEKQVVIKASGNAHPAPLEELSKKPAIINVGRGSVAGGVAHNSMSDPESETGGVDILTPASDDFSPALDYKNNPVKFGGTSQSAPLTTGALANFETIFPGLKADQLKAVLKSTSIPTLGGAGNNNPGMLNAYLLVEVAKKLKESCGDASDTACVDMTISSPWPEKTPEDEIQKMLAGTPCADARSRPLFPPKGPVACNAGIKKAYTQVRKEFFKNPRSMALAKTLACFEDISGFRGNGDYFRSVAAAIEGKTIEDYFLENFEKLGPQARKELIGSVLRRPDLLKERTLEVISNIIKNPKPEDHDVLNMLTERLSRTGSAEGGKIFGPIVVKNAHALIQLSETDNKLIFSVQNAIRGLKQDDEKVLQLRCEHGDPEACSKGSLPAPSDELKKKWLSLYKNFFVIPQMGMGMGSGMQMKK